MTLSIVSLLAAALVAQTDGGTRSVSADLHQSFDVNVPQAPMPVVSDGRVMVAYELHLTNFAPTPLKLVELRVFAQERGRKLATFGTVELAGRVRVLPTASQSSTDLAIKPGGRAIVYVELELPADEKSRMLRHELDYVLPDGVVDTLVPDALMMNKTQPIVLGPPLRGGPWVAVHDPSWPSGHRRFPYAIGGKVRLPGRFAVDWVGTDASGRISRGDPDRPADAIGYNADVLAGADATVWAVRDQLAESPSIRNHPSYALSEEAGNFVALRLEPNRFAFYEHLRPGSIRVRVGERIKKGQVIGSLGSSGHTTGPHLHLHVADCGQPLQCESVPFTVESMDVLGRYDRIEDFGTQIWNSATARKLSRPEWPACNVVVMFP